MQAWKQNDNSSFNFYDAHDINNNYDKSEQSIKASLEERFRNSKIFVLLVGDKTKYLYKYVRWEIEQALNREMPIIVVNLNGIRSMDLNRCPAILRNELAVHVSFSSKILQFALEDWPIEDNQYRNAGKIGPFQYNEKVYEKLGL